MVETQVGEEAREGRTIFRFLMLEWGPAEEGRAPQGWRRGSWLLCDDEVAHQQHVLSWLFSDSSSLSVVYLSLSPSPVCHPLQNATTSILLLCDPYCALSIC